MNQDMPSVMPGYDDRLAMTGRNSWRPRVNLLGGLRAGRKALTSWLKGGSGRQAKRAEKAADTIVNRIRESKDPNLLDRAIELHREALALRPPGHPDRAGSVAKLGVLLCLRYTQTDNIALMDEAIELEREALALQPQAHPERAKSCAYLGSLLYARHHQAGNDVLLVEAIKLQREALVLRSPGHRDRADICTDLGTSLRVRYEQTGDVALLNEAIELQYEVLASRFSGHPGRAKTCADLANSLRVRYHHQTGDIALLDKAIELDREALALRPPGHPDRARGCVGLAASLHMQHQQTGNVALLDEKTELEREALALQPPGHPHRANSCANLAASLHVRYEQTGNVVLLDEAIELQREALASIPPGHRHRADVCVNLGASLRVRYQATGNVALLIDAIQLQLEALTLRPPGHPDRADICANLGCLFHLCYRQTGNVVVLDKAIEFERKALALRLPGHPYRTHICANLGVSLNMRYQQTGNVALLDEAIEICMYASEHSSASQVWHPLTQLSELHLLRKLESPYYSVSKAVDYLQRSFQHEVDNIHSFISTICASVALIWDDFSGWTSHTPVPVAAIYAQVIDRLPLVANFVLNTSSRLQSLKATRRVGSDACVAALLARQPDTAVVFLDRAHGVLWTQALHQRDPQMEDAPKDLAIELEDLLRAIAAYTPVDPARLSDRPQDLCHRQNTRIQAILREIRSMPGLARFMLGSPYETLSEAARDHPVVVLVAARGHAFALIMASSSSTGPDILRLDVANDVLQSFTNSVEQGNLRYRGDSPSRDDGSLADPISPDRAMRPGDHLTRRSPLARLWLSVVKPVLTHLGLTKQEDLNGRPRLHWCTAGDFASLPVHAAGLYTDADQECCADYVVSSYTPTLTSLLRARQDLQPVPTADAKLLLVAADHAATTKLPALAKVQAEMSEISGVADRAGVRYAASSRIVSTPEEATAALPSATLVHIACHGLQDPEEPLESAFHLSDDGVMSVSDLMKLDLKGAYLAFLSACETAKGDRVQSDQAIHLAATMLFAGFKSVVATMWAMRDDDGPVVSKAFYEKLLESDTITADAIPYALDHAVRNLRESGASVERWATFIHVGA